MKENNNKSHSELIADFKLAMEKYNRVKEEDAAVRRGCLIFFIFFLLLISIIYILM